ncbi:MAG TPA: class IV adenylate cyclase [Kofleriaceae bacterium]
MGRNIEIKCSCADLHAVRRRAEVLGARDAGVLVQVDTFFVAPRSRLKLRDFGDGRAELISYVRADRTEARASDYVVAPVTDPEALARALTMALGATGVVRKQRHLFLYKHTRIHLDDVKDLGSYVELETVLTDISDEEGYRELHEIAAALGLHPDDHVAKPYVELLAAMHAVRC